MPKTLRSITLAVAAIALLATAPTQAAEPKRGGTLTYAYHPEPTALSTLATTAVPVAIASTKIYESLLEYEGAGLNPKPGLAESWTVSPDNLTYTFKLRQGVKWHDGKPLTSADVKSSVELVLNYHSRGKTYFGKVAAIETPDTHTVVVGDETTLWSDGAAVDAFRQRGHAPTTELAVQLRYRSKPAPLRTLVAQGERAELRFATPQRAVAPGQAAVLYDGDVVVGGGRILAALP